MNVMLRKQTGEERTKYKGRHGEGLNFLRLSHPINKIVPEMVSYLSNTIIYKTLGWTTRMDVKRYHPIQGLEHVRASIFFFLAADKLVSRASNLPL